MTALPSPPATARMLTVAEYAALPEDADVRYELEEGVLAGNARSPLPRGGTGSW